MDFKKRRARARSLSRTASSYSRHSFRALMIGFHCLLLTELLGIGDEERAKDRGEKQDEAIDGERARARQREGEGEGLREPR